MPGPILLTGGVALLRRDLRLPRFLRSRCAPGVLVFGAPTRADRAEWAQLGPHPPQCAPSSAVRTAERECGQASPAPGLQPPGRPAAIAQRSQRVRPRTSPGCC
ncbi:hypothetical protein QJS66_19410 [Kocuria rhizophila]|nr:hypothetical protein QJS66_19410 [Kocuria rhizophila]